MHRWLLRVMFLAVLLLGGGLAGLHYRTTIYDESIARAAAHNNLDFFFVKAIIYEESWFRPDIRGSSGELGLMQVTLRAARDYASHKGFPPANERRLREPELNLEIGCWYLHQSLERYKDSPAPLVFALFRYNAGEVRADVWLQEVRKRSHGTGMSEEDLCLSVVDFPKTRDYARRILRRSRSHNYFF